MSILPRDDFVTLVLYIAVSSSTFQLFLIGRATLGFFCARALLGGIVIWLVFFSAPLVAAGSLCAVCAIGATAGKIEVTIKPPWLLAGEIAAQSHRTCTV